MSGRPEYGSPLCGPTVVGAHVLYGTLGYRDVYAPRWVVHAPGGAASPRARGVRPARREDLADIERLHARYSHGRLGFLREPNGYLAVAAAAREIDPAKEIVLLRTAGRLQGYAHVDSNPYRTTCGELVGISLAARRTLVSEVQRRSRRTPLAFQQTPVTDSPELFRHHGYSAVQTGWYVLMASALGRTWSQRAAVGQFATNDRRFLCMSGDRF